MEPKTMMMNDVKYVREDSLSEQAESFEGMRAVIVRTYSAGVFYGYLQRLEGKNGVVKQARRMWKWFGASLSECAQSGTPDKDNCKFPEAVDSIELTEIIEVLDLTTTAKASLDSVPVWKA
tara:strand:+ start:3272 stop:3634 length:363 start_codon:yes stop_codon:yes gene_type:complete